MASLKSISVSASGEVSQRSLAAILGLSTRQIRNLEERGLPFRAEKNLKFYPLREAIEWWRGYEVTKALKQAKLSDLDMMRARKTEIEAEQRALELAEQKGELIHADIFAERLATVFGTLRSRLVALKGSLPPRVVGLDTPREAAAVVGPEIDGALHELLEAVEEVAESNAA